MQSINPYNNQFIAEYTEMALAEVNQLIDLTNEAWSKWKTTSFSHRAKLMKKAAVELRSQKLELATLITLEMGKRIVEAETEIEKCAWACDYYAENAAQLLADEYLPSDGQISKVVFQPLGIVLAIMPWNYPFWQTFRFAAPALMAGNAALLKHASNVQGCALAIEKVFVNAGFPEHLFRTLVIGAEKVEPVIANPNVKAVTLTGSEAAGRAVAATAGRYLKKTVLELGGSDPCILLSDANIDEAVEVGLKSRMLTSGQTCISAKRFIVEKEIFPTVLQRMKVELEKYQPGNPLDEKVMLAPLAQAKFAEEIHQQVIASVSMGAKLEMGENYTSGCFYPATLLSGVTASMPVFQQEAFGPVVALIAVENEEEAVEMANCSNFGLGAAIWTTDLQKAERMALQLEAGAVFINGLVKSDPRLPFGGIKHSGYGRELSSYGMKEFCNIKTIWVK
jgi:succinate-semialdehyde dehydrogenase/glutarate-semialdehyde dehydrogenase